MPHFPVSWNRTLTSLCPELVKEEEKEEPALDEEMSMRLIEDLPLPPLPRDLESLEKDGIKNLTIVEISEIEAQIDCLNSPHTSESELQAVLDSDSSLVAYSLWA